MKKVIRHLIDKEDYAGSIRQIEKENNWEEDSVLELIKPISDRFQISGDIIVYSPPYGIFDRNTLHTEVANAKAYGIPFKNIKFAYEFIESDINEMIYENQVFAHRNCKTNELILFAPCTVSPILYDLWNPSKNDNDSEKRNTHIRKKTKI